MKKVAAVIRPGKLEELKVVLNQLGVRGMTIYNVMGRGEQKDVKQYYRGQELQVDLFPKVKVEIVCVDDQVKPIVDTILQVCRTGNIGDGKIFIYDLEEAIRISSGERGNLAL